MKCFFLLLFQLFITIGFTQTLNEIHVVKRILKENKNYILSDSSSFFTNGYMHLEGKIGNKKASIELNIFPNQITAFLFADTLQGILGFTSYYSNGILSFEYDEYKFVGGVKTFSRMYLAFKRDLTLSGYAIEDGTKKVIPCSFKEKYPYKAIRMKNLNFNYSSSVKKFPIGLYGSLLFAGNTNNFNKVINSNLLSSYDNIGLNYPNEVNKMNFNKLEYLKKRKTYKSFYIAKFKKICHKIITNEFIKEAKESGHTDIYLNEVRAEVLCNDGKYLVLQLISNYADGISYPYYETYLFEYDLINKKKINLNVLNTLNHNTKIEECIYSKLKKEKLLDANKGLDDTFFLDKPNVGFRTSKGYVLLRKGGNHGIHNFYKFYNTKIIFSLFVL